MHIQQMAGPLSGKDGAEKGIPVGKRLCSRTCEAQHSDVGHEVLGIGIAAGWESQYLLIYACLRSLLWE